MNLKEAVEEVIESAMIDGWHSMEPETSLWKHNAQQQTRAAITAMREALLSEPAVEAAVKDMTGLTAIGFTELNLHEREVYMQQARNAIGGALAAMGAVTED